MGWKLLHKVEAELFAQMLVTALFTRHRILSQIAGHGMDVLKILPPLIIGEREIEHFVQALDAVLTDCHRFPGPVWDLGANFVRHSLRRSEPVPVSS
jgi:acetylornithine/succinyldiaminopimelate/putrescine aminotransferase